MPKKIKPLLARLNHGLVDSAKPQIKGFSGSGTEQDPLQIGTFEELMGLSRPEVGQQGYYFRQTADIDCTAVSSWPDISFQGHYDGGGHTVKYDYGASCSCLFSRVQTGSSVTQLKLENLSLTGSAEQSEVSHCSAYILIDGDASDCRIRVCKSEELLIFGNASNCTILACQPGQTLIYGNASNCTIFACESAGGLISGTAQKCSINACESGGSIAVHASGCNIIGCESGYFLIWGTATQCTITDCFALIIDDWSSVNNEKEQRRGGIAAELCQSTVVERCFVTGNFVTPKSMTGYIDFTGIAAGDSSCTIRQCAFGLFDLSGSNARWAGRISANLTNPADLPKLENNAVIDSTGSTDESNGADVSRVAAAHFTQCYVEHSLNWDFDTVWQWDAANQCPALRAVGCGAAVHQVLLQPAMQGATMVDLFT